MIMKKQNDICFRYLLVVIFISVLGVVVRYPLRDYISHDASGYLLPWFDEIKSRGGILSLTGQVGNYNVLYQTLIALMTYVPINPLYQYKALSIIFDYLLAAGAAVLVYDVLRERDGDPNAFDGVFFLELSRRRNYRAAIVTYTLVLFSAIVVMNSAVWAQCDSIYSSCILWSLVFLFRKKDHKAFILLGMAFAFKLQAVFILPFFAFYYLYQKRFSILQFLWIPAVMLLSGIPGVIMGRSPFDVFRIYMNQTTGINMYMEYPSFWTICPGVEGGSDMFPEFYKFKTGAMILTVMILIMIIYVVYSLHPVINNNTAIKLAMWMTYTTVYFLPCMTDRYGFLYEIMAIPIAVIDKKTIPMLIAMHLTMYYIYGGRLGPMMSPVSIQGMSFILFIVYLAYGIRLYMDLRGNKEGIA